jgi:hypothetical protein
MIIGEKMSEVIDPETVVEGLDGRLYEDYYSKRMGRPLHTAPTLYARLYQALKTRLNDAEFSTGEIEVYQDHNKAVLTVVVQLRGAVIQQAFNEEYFATSRTSVQKVVQDIVRRISGSQFVH